MEVVKFKIQITARRSATSFTAGGIGSDVRAAMTHGVQFFPEFFLQHQISGLVPTGMEALVWCPVIWALATEWRIQEVGGWVRVDIGGYTMVQKGCYTEAERWTSCGTGWYRRCRIVRLRVP